MSKRTSDRQRKAPTMQECPVGLAPNKGLLCPSSGQGCGVRLFGTSVIAGIRLELGQSQSRFGWDVHANVESPPGGERVGESHNL